MPNLKFKDRSKDHLALALYSAKLAREGASFPVHPKRPGKPHVAEIARQTGIKDWRLRSGELADQLARLVKGRLADPPALRREEAARRINDLFKNKPIPQRFSGYHKDQIAHAVGINVSLIDSAECREAIDALVKSNGLAEIALDRDAERAAFETYVVSLRKDERKLPANAASGSVSVTKIAKAIGLPGGRFAFEPLATLLRVHTSSIGVETVDTLEKQAERLEAFVADEVAVKNPMPIKHGKAALSSIGRSLTIPKHRLRHNKRMQLALQRWQDGVAAGTTSQGDV